MLYFYIELRISKSELKLLYVLLIFKLWTVHYSPKGFNRPGILLGLKSKGVGMKVCFFESFPDAEFFAAYISAVNLLYSYETVRITFILMHKMDLL